MRKSLDMAESEKEAAYQEIGATFRQLDDFRAKLLGFLPLVSGVGIFAILQQQGNVIVPSTLGLLGAVVTLGLGIHEFRTILRCKALIDAGRQLEQALGLDSECGLFQQYPCKFPYPLISTGVASAIVYVSVFVAWLYVWCRGSPGT
jgi:hypothetical protein